jgi:hypothetical protein
MEASMSAVWVWIIGPIGRWVVTALGVAGLVAAFAADQRGKGAEKERARIEKKAEQNVKKADDVRDRVRRDTGGMRDPARRD